MFARRVRRHFNAYFNFYDYSGDLEKSDRVVKRWHDTEIVIIDKVSMLSLRTVENIHSIAQGVRKSKQTFGGVQIVACGDFKQLPPVSSSIDPG